jgi:hypothetical protein
MECMALWRMEGLRTRLGAVWALENISEHGMKYGANRDLMSTSLP